MSNEQAPLLKQGIAICVIAALFYCYEFILRATPGIMVHELMTSYQVRAEAIAMLSISYHFLYTPLQLPAGILMDKYGPKRLLAASVLLCTIGSMIMYYCLNIYLGNFAQLIIGAGSAFAFVGALKLASNWLPANRFALFAGITTTLGMLGAAGTNIFLIHMKNNIGWHNIWYLLGLAGIFVSLMMFILLKDSPTQHSEKNKAPVISWQEFYQVCCHLVRQRSFWLISMIGGILFLPLTVIGTLWGVAFLVDAYEYSDATAGMATSMIFLGMALGGPIAGWTSEFLFSRLTLLRAGTFLAGVISLLLISVHSYPFAVVCSLIFLLGFVLGAEILVFAMAADLVDKRFTGTAVSATNFLLMVPILLVQPFIGFILEYEWNGTMLHDHAIYTANNYYHALSIIPTLCFSAFLLTFLLPRTKLQ